MAAEWYYKVMGEPIGPLTSAELHRHAQEGSVLPDTFVRRGAEGWWIAADKVKGLFDSPHPVSEVVSGPGHQAPPKQESADWQTAPESAAKPPHHSSNTPPGPSVPLNWAVGGGVALVLLFVVVLVVMQGSGSNGSNRSNSSPSYAPTPIGGYVAPIGSRGASPTADDTKSQREKAVRAEIESLRFEITQMKDKERDLQRQIDEIEGDKRRADVDLQRVRDPISNQGTYFAIMQRSQDLSIASIKKAREKYLLQEDILRKNSKLSEAESTLRRILNP